MWNYQKRLQYPVKIKNADPAMARIVLAQLGGPDGEMGAATRYLNQRYAMPYDEGKAILTDIGTSVSVEAPLGLSAPPTPRKTGQACLSAVPPALLRHGFKVRNPIGIAAQFLPQFCNLSNKL